MPYRRPFAPLLAFGFVVLAAAVPAAQARAQAPAAEAATAAPSEDAGPRLPLWEFGVFGIAGTQQAYPGSAQRVRPTLALPFLVYRGPLLRAEQGNVGLRALKTPTTELDIGFAGSFGSNASDSAVRRGMPDIGTLVEFGPRLRIDLGPAPGDGRLGAAVSLRGVFDLSDGMRSRGLTFEPGIGWSRRSTSGWRYGVNASALIGDRRIANTFYGVDPVYATAVRPAYQADAGLIAWRLSTNLSRRLSEDWRLFAYLRTDSVAGAANRASPLVERTWGWSGGVGLAWTWMRSEADAPR